jgi:opacity protein-like surface antigen
MKKKTFLIIGFIVLIVYSLNAQSVDIGPQIGYYKVPDADNGSYMVGLALRLKLGSALGVEASFNYRSESYANNLLKVRSLPVMLTGLLYPLPFVYGALGFGWYNLTYDYDQTRLPLFTDETTQKVGWHFGGGLELPIGSNVLLTGDIRYVFLNYDFKQFPGSGGVNSNFTILTVGLLFGL